MASVRRARMLGICHSVPALVPLSLWSDCDRDATSPLSRSAAWKRRGLWANLKGRELANLCEDDIDDVEVVARQGVRRVRRCRDLLFGFLRHTGLDL
jgi:hypothetical protein